MKLKTLPIGQSDYREIINRNQFYVDKTLLLKELLDSGSLVSLIVRPRRFGKTTNLTMIRYFFEKHLNIEFKNQAVKRTMSGNYTIKEVSESLGVSYDSLKTWRKDYMKREEESSGDKVIDIKILEEFKQLKKDYNRLKEENAILKKFAAILSKDQDLV